MLALADYEAGVCDCGMHKSIADTDPAMEMAERICPVCSGLARNLRVIADLDGKSVDAKAPPEAARPSDGRHLSLRMKPSKSVVGVGEQIPEQGGHR